MRYPNNGTPLIIQRNPDTKDLIYEPIYMILFKSHRDRNQIGGFQGLHRGERLIIKENNEVFQGEVYILSIVVFTLPYTFIKLIKLHI